MILPPLHCAGLLQYTICGAGGVAQCALRHIAKHNSTLISLAFLPSAEVGKEKWCAAPN
jgi:hypothetical protein